MRRILALIGFLLLFSVFGAAQADSYFTCSLTAVNSYCPGSGGSAVLNGGIDTHNVYIVPVGTPGTITVLLQGSVIGDFSDAVTCGTSSTTTANLLTCSGIYTRVRVNLSVLTGFTTVNITYVGVSSVTKKGGGGVSLSASSPIVVSPNPITGTGTISCPTCSTGGVTSFNSRTGAVTPQSGDYTASLVGLGSVTNDAQTKAAIMPNTVPSAGQFPRGNGSAYVPGAILSADVPNNAANTSGNAATATAAASVGTECSAGQAARGVDASWNGKDCFTPSGAVSSVFTRTGAVTAQSGDYTATQVGLGNVTNDAQTKAAIVPNTAPSAGQIPVGNAGGTAYAPVTMSGSCTMTSAGVTSCAGGSPAFNTITSGTNTTAAMVVGSGASFTTSGTGTNTATAVPVTGVTGLGSGIATFLATPTSANLAAAMTTSTGTGLNVFNNGPTLIAPNLGTPASGVVTNLTGTGGFNITGTAANLSGTPALPNGTTAPTQTQLDGSTKLATTLYADTAVSNAVAGVNPAIAVQAATTSAGNTSGFTYNNGASGIGATFTGAVNTAVTIDGYTFTAVGQRLLVKNDTQSPSGAFNGIYSMTVLQTGILAPVFTRALDYDTPSDMNNTGAIPVVNGTVNASTSWLMTAQIVTVGTTPLTFTQFSLNPSNLVTAASPGVGLCHFAGSTQACTSSAVVAADTDTSIAHTGVDINTSYQVTATHLAAALPVNQGGSGTTSTLTGVMRGGSPMTASEISGDCTTSGSNALTCVQIHGANYLVNSSGLVTKDNGITTAGYGHPIEIANGKQTAISLTSGTGQLGSTVTVTIPATGEFEVHYELTLTTAGSGGTCTTGSVAVQGAWTNGLSGTVYSAFTLPLWTIGSTSSTGIIAAAPINNISVSSTSDWIEARPVFIYSSSSIVLTLNQTVLGNCTVQPVIAFAYSVEAL